MDKELNKKSLMLGIPGILLQIVGRVIMTTQGEGAMSLVGVVVALVGTVMLIAGLSWYARAKGHSGWWGLMGLLSIIGLIILAVLPDKRK